MKISFESKSSKADALIVFGGEGGKFSGAGEQADKKTGGALKRLITAEKFTGKKGASVTLIAPEGLPYTHIILLGTGGVEKLTLQDFEKFGSQLTAALNAKRIAAADVAFDTEFKAASFDLEQAAARMALGAQLNSYRFDKYLTKEPKDKKPTLTALNFTVPDAARARKVFSTAQKTADAVFLTRDLVNEVPNVLYPESFADIIKRELTPLGIEVNILGPKEMQKLGMGAIIAVGKGSERLPRLVSMQYKGGGKNDRNIAFVGKGVTFDSGGISIKPGPGMEEMKWDMAGAGAVTGLMKLLAARSAKINAIGIVGLAENMPSGLAYRPGDIVTSMSGQTIEVHNTDAEGRLVLCDALWYCQEKFKPTHIVDMATLTGAVIIALGHEYAGAFSNDDAFVEQLRAAGKKVGEEIWPMPLNDAWDKAIDCLQADMKNISGGRDAGSAIGAHFLKRYIQDGVKWTHLDIAGVAWSNKDRTSIPKGASAFGLRLLDTWVADTFEKS